MIIIAIKWVFFTIIKTQVCQIHPTMDDLITRTAKRIAGCLNTHYIPNNCDLAYMYH